MSGHQPTVTTSGFQSVADFAAAVGASAETVRRWIAAGTIAATRVGGRVLIPRSEVDRLHAEAMANVGGGRDLRVVTMDAGATVNAAVGGGRRGR